MSFVSEAEWFYYLMDTVDLGEEPPLDIVPLKENNPLKSPQDSYLLTFKILWLRAYPSHTVGTRVPGDLSHWSVPCWEDFSLDLKALKALRLWEAHK